LRFFLVNCDELKSSEYSITLKKSGKKGKKKERKKKLVCVDVEFSGSVSAKCNLLKRTRYCSGEASRELA
jgi:hypothetical protein